MVDDSADANKIIRMAGLAPQSIDRIPQKRQDLLKWDGWGYKDSWIGIDEKSGGVIFAGNRYAVSGKHLPTMRAWVDSTFGLRPEDWPSKTVEAPLPRKQVPPPTLHDEFIAKVKSYSIEVSTDPADRMFRSHGHDLHGIYGVRNNLIERYPDVIVWPRCHDDVEKIVKLGVLHDVALIPFGGGTCVSGALDLSSSEQRCIVSVDTSQMNKLLWVDEANLVCRVEAGVFGEDLEAMLKTRGYQTGHEPDSLEFSSVGGWVATRASGMKKNLYGNIEDLLLQVKIVTAKGTIERLGAVPRVSAGPDIQHYIMGSEGTLGIITEVGLKIRPCPKVQKFGSIVFPDFPSGVACMREIARQRCAPASIRLVDNEQFKFGQTLKPASDSWFGSVGDNAKRMYVTCWKGFDLDKLTAATLVFEGDNQTDIESHEAKIYGIAKDFGGFAGGEENGKRGYTLTYAIAYLRDMAIELGLLGESFETSVPWDRVLELCAHTKRRIKEECVAAGLTVPPFVTCRVTQTYDSGACVYFYFAFNSRRLSNPLAVYQRIESAARDEVMGNGGSISHHHGIGKLRQRWMRDTVGETGIGAMKAVKAYLDPTNVFAAGNLWAPGADGVGGSEKSKL